MNYCNYKQGAGPRLARSGNRIVLKQMVSSLRTSMRGGSIISEGRRNVEAMNDIGQHVQDLEESAYTPVKI